MPRSKNAISVGEAKHRGEILNRLRDKLDLTLDDVVALSGGHLTRSEVIRVQDGVTMWNSRGPWLGYGAALSLNETQLGDLFTGRLGFMEAVQIALPKVTEYLRRKATKKSQEQDVLAVAREGLARAGLIEHELADVILPALCSQVRKRGIGINRAELAETAQTILTMIIGGEKERAAREAQRQELDTPKRESGSHRSDPKPPRGGR